MPSSLGDAARLSENEGPEPTEVTGRRRHPCFVVAGVLADPRLRYSCRDSAWRASSPGAPWNLYVRLPGAGGQLEVELNGRSLIACRRRHRPSVRGAPCNHARSAVSSPSANVFVRERP